MLDGAAVLRTSAWRHGQLEGRVESGELVTVAEAAVRLSRSSEQVRRYLREGRLTGTRIGGQWFIHRDVLASFGHEMREERGFLDRIPPAMESAPLNKIIGIGAGGGSNLAEGMEAYRRAFRWRR